MRAGSAAGAAALLVVEPGPPKNLGLVVEPGPPKNLGVAGLVLALGRGLAKPFGSGPRRGPAAVVAALWARTCCSARSESACPGETPATSAAVLFVLIAFKGN